MTGKPVLIIDSCSDLPAAVVEDLGVEVLNFPYTLSGREHLDDFGRAQSHADFYAAMRAGDHPTTAQIPRQVFLDTFRTHAAAGEPVLYLGFSSALSGTFDVAWLARQDVLAEYPDAEIRLIDTRAAAVAEGLVVYEAAQRWRDGMPLADIEAWVLAERPRLNGWFIVDDLETLRRGGRLPGAVAAAGSLLDVKPLLRVTDDGRLEVKKSIRGRQKSMRTLADLVADRAADPAGQTIAVAHGDCAEDAARLRDMITERVVVKDILTMEVGAVIGTHTGPGMLAVVFWGEA
ncbi:MAG: DegV family protein [Coriobacteriia bacterium]|nr:DegV family protein [Coriobacteriia bacterium]